MIMSLNLYSPGDLVTIKKPLSLRHFWLSKEIRDKFDGSVGQIVSVTHADLERTEKGSWVTYYMVEVKGDVLDFLDSEVEVAFTV